MPPAPDRCADARLDLEVLSLAHSFLLRYVTFLTLTLTNRLLVVKIALGLLASTRPQASIETIHEVDSGA